MDRAMAEKLQQEKGKDNKALATALSQTQDQQEQLGARKWPHGGHHSDTHRSKMDAHHTHKMAST